MNSDYLKVVLNYWANEYSWRKFETTLNQFPQYKTQISGLNIHFIRVTPQVAPHVKVLPILILHGWPGSVKEFERFIPLLTKPRKGENFVFEVIAPSLPGYGWSEAAAKSGLGSIQMALLMKKLMLRLGHSHFYVHGGDWGGIIGASMATLYPENVKGFHSNFCLVYSPLKHLLGSLYPPLVVEDKYAHRMYPLSKELEFVMRETGYFHIQATKPDTLGAALLDSPSGLAAYIIEKFITASDKNSFPLLWRDSKVTHRAKRENIDNKEDLEEKSRNTKIIETEDIENETFEDVEANQHLKDIEEDKDSYKVLKNEPFNDITVNAPPKDRNINEPFRVSLLNNDSTKDTAKEVNTVQVNDPSKVIQLKNDSSKDTKNIANSSKENGASDSFKVTLLKDTTKVVQPNQIEGVSELSKVIKFNSANLEDVLDDVTLYWVTRTIMSSMRLYAESPILDVLGLLR
ncbi:hypothetical protein WDU94_011536 [Cyamophila willieti]